MIALRVLLISQVIVILCSPVAYAVPVYGTKKYVRSPVVARPISVWDQDVPSYHPVSRTQRHSTYPYDTKPYDTNPYASYYDHYYYHPRDYYPVYYPKTSKYEVYQAVVPYYYNDAHSMDPSYMYDYNSADPLIDIEDEQRQRAIAERENAQALGQEMFYENDDTIQGDDNMDAINTAFLQNLIMTQIYNDAMDKNRYHQGSTEQAYGKWDEYPLVDNHDYYHADDDERELKMVANMNSVKDEDRLNFFNKGTHPNKKYASKRDDQFNFQSAQSTRKSNILTTVQPPVKTFRKGEGQKEEVLHRPATPVVHRMSQPGLGKNQEPSVYDTIKHMLNMEKELETHNGDVKRKRDIRSSEDSLTKQLSLLKKSI